MLFFLQFLFLGHFYFQIQGGIDFDIKLWDFQGMDSSLRCFRSLQPCERYGSYFARYLKTFRVHKPKQLFCCHKVIRSKHLNIAYLVTVFLLYRVKPRRKSLTEMAKSFSKQSKATSILLTWPEQRYWVLV